jgi:hypothetical protein
MTAHKLQVAQEMYRSGQYTVAAIATTRQLSRCRPRTCVRYTGRVGTWHDPDLGRPIAAPLERCAQLLGAELATVRTLAATVEPYLRADGTRIWSLMQLERQLRPEAYRRRRGGYLDRRQAPTADAAPTRATVSIHSQITSSLDLPLEHRTGIQIG